MRVPCSTERLVGTGYEVGIVLFTQTMPAIKLYPVQVFVSNIISTPRGGVESGVTNEDIIGVSVTGFFIQSSQDVFEDFP